MLRSLTRRRNRTRGAALSRFPHFETLENRQLLSVNPTWEIPIEYASEVATDALGNAYLGESDGGQRLIAKYDPSGQQVWQAALDAWIGSMAVDAANNIYVAGSFDGEDDIVVLVVGQHALEFVPEGLVVAVMVNGKRERVADLDPIGIYDLDLVVILARIDADDGLATDIAAFTIEGLIALPFLFHGRTPWLRWGEGEMAPLPL